MICLKPNRAIFGLFMLTLLLCWAVSYSYAQNRVTYATAEDIAIAFSKTGGKVPNFESWIKARKPYNLTPWAARAAMMEKETARLQQSYLRFNPEEDFLIIRTFVDVNTQENRDPEGNITHKIDVRFSKAPEALYFPYDFMDQRFVVMPHMIDKIMQADITSMQHQLIADSARTSAENTMIVRLKATEADFSSPHMIDGLEQWVLKAEVVSLEIWNTQGRLIWEYTAPWYLSPNTKELHGLFEKRPIGTNEKGSVKPLF